MINDDNIVEEDESLSLQLDSVTLGVSLNPSVTTVTITDNENFSPVLNAPSTVSEGETIEVCVSVGQNVQLARSVTVEVQTVSGTAEGMRDCLFLSLPVQLNIWG